MYIVFFFFFFSSRRRHTRWNCDWSSDVCSSDLPRHDEAGALPLGRLRTAVVPPRRQQREVAAGPRCEDRKSTRLNSSHSSISYAVFCLKKKKRTIKCTTS